ncbi:Rrf2 family transcriptional regulator [Pelagibius litoralis]|uniref:Rrf2 family transcriptional regulator n=1 Tax=Pelagibius litoralis TaxID=374515 RepID=A0A967F2Q1_9PROT|nr:Rrf2 family transcriptional regulator [Pelagibius litoralis]NIA72101.1 Rrf2 family transcriptional regulator [Pelagibius litoralis]
MQISSSAYMGVETLVRLAVQNADKPCSTKGLAEWINRSVSYTEALMAQLRSAGLVVSRHGPGGGYMLAKPAQRITVAEVFQAVDAPSNFASRPLNADTLEAADIHDLHGTDLLWEALKSAVLSFLNDVSLADLTPESPELISVGGNDRADMRSTARHCSSVKR